MNIKECSFCKKPTSHAEYVFTSEYTDAVICDECVIMLCMKILVDKYKDKEKIMQENATNEKNNKTE